MIQRTDNDGKMTRFSEMQHHRQSQSGSAASQATPSATETSPQNRAQVRRPDWLLVLTITFFLLAILIVWLVGIPALFD